MSNQPTPITDDEIRSVLYRMAAHVSFFAEPRTPDPKASAFADVLMSAVRPTEPPPPPVPSKIHGVFLSDADYNIVLTQLNRLAVMHFNDHAGEFTKAASEALSRRVITSLTN